MKHIDTIIKTSLWADIPREKREAIISMFYIIYGSSGLGLNNMSICDIDAETYSAAITNVHVNAERFSQCWNEFKLISNILDWSIERVNWIENVIDLALLTKNK